MFPCRAIARLRTLPYRQAVKRISVVLQPRVRFVLRSHHSRAFVYSTAVKTGHGISRPGLLHQTIDSALEGFDTTEVLE
jgi:hypothetical protein